MNTKVTMISSEEFQKIAKLARLKISPEEEEAYRKEFSKMIDYMDELKELDLSEVEPMTKVDDNPGFLRKDEVQESLDSEKAFKNAPSVGEGHFTIPKVIG